MSKLKIANEICAYCGKPLSVLVDEEGVALTKKEYVLSYDPCEACQSLWEKHQVVIEVVDWLPQHCAENRAIVVGINKTKVVPTGKVLVSVEDFSTTNISYAFPDIFSHIVKNGSNPPEPRIKEVALVCRVCMNSISPTEVHYISEDDGTLVCSNCGDMELINGFYYFSGEVNTFNQDDSSVDAEIFSKVEVN